VATVGQELPCQGQPSQEMSSENDFTHLLLVATQRWWLWKRLPTIY